MSDPAPLTGIRAAPALLVARALARSWLHRPIRLAMAIVGGIGGVLLTTAVLLIAIPVLESTRTPPVEGVAANVVAVVARAPAGVSGGLTREVRRRSGAAATSRVLVENTTMKTAGGDFTPIVMLGVDKALPAMLKSGVKGAPRLRRGEVFLERSWARSHGLRKGDRVAVTTPSGLVSWKVGALSDRSFANNGSSMLVPAPTVANAFHRGDAADMLLLRPKFDAESVRERVAPLLHGAAEITAPDQVFASYGRIYLTPLSLVSMFAGITLLLGTVVLFLTWRLALAEARPILSRLRLLGVRYGDLLVGSGIVLLPILLASYAIGATLGCVVGNSLSSFRGQITNFTGQAFDPSLSLTIPLLGAFVAAALMFGFAWLVGLWQLRRATPIDAIAGRDTVATSQSLVRWPVLVGTGCFALAAVALVFASAVVRGIGMLPLLVGVALLSAVLPGIAGGTIRLASSGSSGLLVGRQLQVEWRRNAALGITFAIALLTSIVMFGVASSIRDDINSSNDRWTQGQVYVTAAPLGHNYGGETFPASVRARIAAVPGVRSTDTFSYVNAIVRGGRHLVESVGGDAAKLTSPQLTAGPPAVLSGREDLFEALRGDRIAISSNFARTQGLGVGSAFQIPTSAGHRTAHVVAVIDDAVSDGGMVMVGRDLFHQVAGSSRIFYVGAGLAAGADAGAVRDRLATLMGRDYPRAQVLTVDEYRADVSSMLSRLMSSFTIFAWVMYFVAAIVGTATLASSIAERSRAVALTRLVGGRRRSIRSLFGVEAMITVIIAWLIAVVGALLAIPAMIAGQSAFSGLLPSVQIPVEMIAVSLPMAALATAVALFIARRTLSELPLAELVSAE
jgi:putative ABC transport system permease protein